MGELAGAIHTAAKSSGPAGAAPRDAEAHLLAIGAKIAGNVSNLYDASDGVRSAVRAVEDIARRPAELVPNRADLLTGPHSHALGLRGAVLRRAKPKRPAAPNRSASAPPKRKCPTEPDDIVVRASRRDRSSACRRPPLGVEDADAALAGDLAVRLGGWAAGQNFRLTRWITMILVEDVEIFKIKEHAGVIDEHFVRRVVIRVDEDDAVDWSFQGFICNWKHVFALPNRRVDSSGQS